MPRRDLTNDEGFWAHWQSSLAGDIASLQLDEFFILDCINTDGYVQFCRDRRDGVHILIGETSLENSETPTRRQTLLDQGWAVPGSFDESSPNYVCVWQADAPGEGAQWLAPYDLQDAARMALTTLRVVMGISAPEEVSFDRGSFR